uniref:Enoyl-CoA hydratase n=1 Tax=Panagrolaimus sp. JU765 TaxID=591449 RepID=A0AC34PXN2_9BILA
MLDAFSKIVEELKFDKTARVLILRSDVPGAFCTGADLKERKTMPVDEVPKFVDRIRRLTSDLANLPIPVIAAIDGYALGGGLEIALACDIRVATKEAKMGLTETKLAIIPGAGGGLEIALACDIRVATKEAKMGLTETKLAIIPGAGGTQRLTRAVGLSKAKELIFTAKMIDGVEAEKIGLITQVVDDKKLIFTAKMIDGVEAEKIGLITQVVDDKSSVPYAIKIAEDILKNGPIAIKVAKTAVDLGSQTDLVSGLIIEQQCHAQVIPTQDRLEALKAFSEKRQPVFKGE